FSSCIHRLEELRAYAPGIYLLGESTETSSASVQVISTLSPTITPARADLSCTLDEYFQSLGPVNVIDGVFASIAVIVAVMVRCFAAVPPVRICPAGVVLCADASTTFSPGRFN